MSSLLCVQPCIDESPFHHEQITPDRPLLHCYSCRRPLTIYERSDSISHYECPFALRLVNESGINVHGVRSVNSQIIECTAGENTHTLPNPIKIESPVYYTRKSFESKSHTRQWIIVTYVSMYEYSNGSDSENDVPDDNCNFDDGHIIINRVLSAIRVYPGVDYRPHDYVYDEDLVMAQTGVSMDVAEEALARFSGDIVNAILFINESRATDATIQ